MSARILVVDDVPANVKLLEARLSAEYFDVLTASNGAEALDICARAECDIILLDVMMPDIDGFEVCRRLKASPATHFIPVVMVTALDSPADRVRGLEAGADDFLTKPVSDIVLIARVRSLTRLKMMTDELRMLARDRRAGAGAKCGGRYRQGRPHPPGRRPAVILRETRAGAEHRA
jgi:two-component system cell cycle response regulator